MQRLGREEVSGKKDIYGDFLFGLNLELPSPLLRECEINFILKNLTNFIIFTSFS